MKIIDILKKEKKKNLRIDVNQSPCIQWWIPWRLQPIDFVVSNYSRTRIFELSINFFFWNQNCAKNTVNSSRAIYSTFIELWIQLWLGIHIWFGRNVGFSVFFFFCFAQRFYVTQKGSKRHVRFTTHGNDGFSVGFKNFPNDLWEWKTFFPFFFIGTK